MLTGLKKILKKELGREINMLDTIAKNIPEKNIDLEKLGLINQNLFLVDGVLAKRYNKVLKSVFGYECDVDSFRIDKRGLSPELAIHLKEKYPNNERLEYGENYLNFRSANRYMVIVSPDQKDAELVAPQTSYDDSLCERVHDIARHTIEDVTQSEALFGELENKIDLYQSADDLVNIRTISINLDTLNKTVASTIELRKLADNLGVGNNALDQDYINKMQELVKEVGDPRYRPISEIFPIKREIHCFYAEFFRGVHCLRNFARNKRVKTILIHHHQEDLSEKDYGRQMLVMDLHCDSLFDELTKYDFLGYNPNLIDIRIKEIQDQVLLGNKVDIVSLSPVQRKNQLSKYSKKLPKIIQDLKHLKRQIGHTRKKFSTLVNETKSYEIKLKLAEPKSKKNILNHMLAEIDTSDKVRLYEFNRKKLITEFPGLPLNVQRYIAYKILENKFQGGKK